MDKILTQSYSTTFTLELYRLINQKQRDMLGALLGSVARKRANKKLAGKDNATIRTTIRILQRADAQAAITRMKDVMQQRTQRAAGTAAVTGATEETEKQHKTMLCGCYKQYSSKRKIRSQTTKMLYQAQRTTSTDWAECSSSRIRTWSSSRRDQ